ncbi:16S rRNA (guanine(527)-N(7))-methyltransferase RsmG [Marinicella sp. S1101]|uniref:16S rRNA (guanine(527)-N(7))-methyltransferase RsmG n=1 Tax=Marinicella marina TaxID=2996016 RepID=UPI002260F5A6|nr:16S rRNA (guanine(527)-N(7))-methyltransferase RsmG [Marinicella marina]MCX7552462.1 16S rRNA (guanine(527)-N(7))-methyltransferase RsmG [Marinicella marina]MDJ1139338.1 16S rRNA (guanine(527)-N(7))-methyltransferase RsmG [Marinicella marina]
MNEAKLIKLQTNKLIAGMEMLALDVDKAPTIMSYLQLLQKWNKAYNLTAIKQLDEMVTHHALDALAVIKYFTGQRVVDVGTGGGIPGFLLAIMCPEKSVTLLDAVGKKARFMRQVKRELTLSNAEVVHSRVENYFPEEKFDVVTSRAFSEMGQFLSISSHLVTNDGIFLAMKGPRPEPLHADLPFEQNACWDIDVPFLAEQRKLYRFKKTTR